MLPMVWTIIEGGGKTLIPGLSDAHVHLAMTLGVREIRNNADVVYTSIRAAKSSREFFLMFGLLQPFRDFRWACIRIKKSC